jgi:hypothetical protein
MGRALLLDMARVDVSDAADFGEIVEVFDETHRRPPIFKPDVFAETLGKRLQELHYDPECDSIIVSGSTAVLVSVAAYLGQRHNRFSALVFDTRDRCYRRLTLGGQHANC